MAERLSLLEQVRRCLRLKHYSIRTERAYAGRINRFILFHGRRHPKEMGSDESRQFLSHPATDGRVAAATQNQALNDWAMRIAARRGRARACVALARKLAGILYAMWRDGMEFAPEALRHGAAGTAAAA